MKIAMTSVWMMRRTKRMVMREIILLLLCSIPWTEVKKSLMILIYLYNSRPLDLSQDGENIVVVVEIRGFTSVAKSPVLKQASPFKGAFGGKRPISPVFL